MTNRVNIGAKGSKLDYDNWGVPVTQAINDFETRITNLTPGSWTLITLGAGWVNRVGYAPASYRKIFNGSTLQIVLNIQNGTTTNGTTIFTLPVGFRPIGTCQVSLATRVAATPQQLGALEIDTAGAAKIFDIGASITLHLSGMIPLDLS